MSKNIEIKARYPDLEKGKRVARQIKARFQGTDVQMDTFFRVPNGRMKLRESSLDGARLIPYLRPDQLAAKEARYVLLPVAEVKATKELLAAMFGILVVVRKERQIYRYRNVRIHLDVVNGLGNFIEFEAVIDQTNDEKTSRQRLKMLMMHFGIGEHDLIPNAYADLLLQQTP